MSKVLLIGGSGDVGQSLLPFFSEAQVANSKQFPLPYIPDPFPYSDTDIVINLAGISLLNELHKYSLLNTKVVQVNCLGAVTILNAFLPLMRKRKFGRIIFFSSVCAEINLVGHGVYSATKAFVDKLVKIAAIENASYGITVNSIQLGYTGLGMSKSTPENMDRQKNKAALKRFCTPQELYNAIDFIIKTEYFTGQNLRLDGGIR